MKKLRIRAALYARYSSDNQREESTIAQLRAGREHAKKKDYVIVAEYKDEELTGRNDRRDDFQRMIRDAKRGLFDVVIIHKFNRFARNRYDSAVYKRMLKKAGVRVESVLQPLDDSPESVLLEALLEGMDEYYSLDLGREVMKGMFENADQGIHTGGRPPYGLKVNPETRRYEIDETKYKAVQIYFECRRDGVSRKNIAKKLNDLGYRTQTGKKFTRDSFYGWDTNRKYQGDYVFNVASSKDLDGRRNTNKKKPIEEQVIKKGIIPKILNPKLFGEVNEMIKQRQFKPGQMKAQVNYLLTGKVFCGQCGATYNGNSYRNSKSKDNTILSYYKCSGRCKNASVRKENLERIVIEQLTYHCFSRQAMDNIVVKVKELYDERRKETQADISPIKKEIKNLEATIENWIQALGKGIRGLEERIVEAQNRIALLNEELEHITMLQEETTINDKMIIQLLTEKKDALYSDDENEKKRIIQEYVDKVIINPSDNINTLDVEITYRVFNGGGEGNCTPVSKSCHKSVYACILLFKLRLMGSRRQDPSEAISIILANDSENCH